MIYNHIDDLKKLKYNQLIIDNQKISEKNITSSEENFLTPKHFKTINTTSTRPMSKKYIQLSRNIRKFIFFIFVFISIMINMDHGTIPAATAEIKKSLDLGDDVLGFFGSLVFLGNIIGSLLSFTIINSVNRKYLLVFSLFFNGILLFLFTLFQNYLILFADRVLALVTIYLPVWCDQFGIKNKKTIMISIIQSGTPLGVVLGYMLTSLLKKQNKWELSFQIQAIFSGILSFIILFIPSIYFSSTLNSEKNNLISLPEKNEINNANNLDDNISSRLNNTRSQTKDLTFYKENSFIKNNEKNIFYNFCAIFKEKVFIFCVLALSNLFFVITAIQYWASDYEKDVLGITDENNIFISFAIVCITSPTLGLLFGGLISSKFGGYESKHSITICFIFALLAGGCSIPVPITNDLFYFTIFLWFVLFFGGAILPNIIGIIISSLPQRLRGSANSVTNFLTNLLGYLPAPVAYGFIYHRYKKDEPKLAMMIIIYSSFFGCIMLLFAMYFRYKIKKNEEILDKRKNSVLSNNTNLTMKLARMFNPNCDMIGNNIEETLLENDDEINSAENRNNEKIINKEIEKYNKIYNIPEIINSNNLSYKKCYKNLKNLEDFSGLYKDQISQNQLKNNSNNSNINDKKEKYIFNFNRFKEDLSSNENNEILNIDEIKNLNLNEDNKSKNISYKNLSIGEINQNLSLKTANFNFLKNNEINYLVDDKIKYENLTDKENLIFEASEDKKINLLGINHFNSNELSNLKVIQLNKEKNKDENIFLCDSGIDEIEGRKSFVSLDDNQNDLAIFGFNEEKNKYILDIGENVSNLNLETSNSNYKDDRKSNLINS